MENIYGLQSLQHSVPGLSQKAGLTSALWHPYGIEGSQLPLVSTDPGDRETREGCPCILHEASSDLQLLSLFCFTLLTKRDIRSLWGSFTQSHQSQRAPLLHTHWCSRTETDVAPSGAWMLTVGCWAYGTIFSIYLGIYCVDVCTHMCTRGQPQVSVIPQKQ